VQTPGFCLELTQLTCPAAAASAAITVAVVFPAAIIKEVAMMRMLAGHPCAVQLQAVYEDKSSYYLVGVGRQLGAAAGLGSLNRQLNWQLNWQLDWELKQAA
jgi:hypothetical protein